MRLERLSNLPFNAVKPNIVAIFVYFVTAASFIEISSSLVTVVKREAVLFLFGCSEVNSTLLANQCARKALFTSVENTKITSKLSTLLINQTFVSTPH